MDTAQLENCKASIRGLLGELLLRENLITESQLREALRIQRELDPHSLLGQILVDLNLITQEELHRVLSRYRKKDRLGDILVETNVITEEQLAQALEFQRETGLHLGDALVQLNVVTEEQVRQALCTQLGVTFVDLDRLILDPDLANLIDENYANQHRVIPIARIQNSLTLAMDDPADMRTVDAVRASTGCKINVVTSTNASFQRALKRAYTERLEVGLSQEHEELREAHERLRRELEAQVELLAELRTAHDALRREHAATTHALRGLEARYHALLDERRRAAKDIDGILRRLRPLP